MAMLCTIRAGAHFGRRDEAASEDVAPSNCRTCFISSRTCLNQRVCASRSRLCRAVLNCFRKCHALPNSEVLLTNLTYTLEVAVGTSPCPMNLEARRVMASSLKDHPNYVVKSFHPNWRPTKTRC
ncbi:hypothetical protein AK812_SmicGene49150 [Symbiodinium microadriaticum]|uniref:Uncharacterized protein n=1 Tax=Symbiodinium microadriaticum TaxID=2951 RepID=A0A1Q9EMT5_SYMMI|nr:hypothetical protein AK812_SmicGene49150 [Symbiodinium microadriaticum]